MPVSADALRGAVAPVVEAAGLDLEDVVIRPAGRRSLVRVVVDADGGLTLDMVAAISGPISEAIDESGQLGESPYSLEVTSPGVDRPLTEPRHWRRARGRLVTITLNDDSEVTARIVSSTDTDVVVTPSEGQHADEQTVAYDDIAHAVMQVEFGSPTAGER